RAAVYVAKQHSKRIQGREVGGRDIWEVRWTLDRKRQDSVEIDCVAWSPIKQVSQGRTATVYNISVEEDESYVDDGLIVHNCTHFSTARGGRPVNPQSRASAWHVLKWAQELYIDTIL